MNSTTTKSEEDTMTNPTYWDIPEAVNVALLDPTNPSAIACIETWHTLHVAADEGRTGRAIAAAWLLRALEYEHGMYHPTTRLVGAWMGTTDHRLAARYAADYGTVTA